MASPAGQGEAREKPQWSHPQIHSQTYTDAHIPAHTHTYTLMQRVLSHTCFPTHIHIHACVFTPTHIHRPIGGSFNSTPNLLQRLQHSSLAALVQTGPRKEGDLALLPPGLLSPAKRASMQVQEALLSPPSSQTLPLQCGSIHRHLKGLPSLQGGPPNPTMHCNPPPAAHTVSGWTVCAREKPPRFGHVDA